MNPIRSLLVCLKNDRRAVTALEYGLIAAVVVTVGLAGFTTLETALSSRFENVGGQLTDTPGG